MTNQRISISQTTAALIDTNGSVHLLEDNHFTKSRHVLATILDAGALDEESNTAALLSEQALAVDWNRPEEDEAWAHLQPSKKPHEQK